MWCEIRLFLLARFKILEVQLEGVLGSAEETADDGAFGEEDESEWFVRRVAECLEVALAFADD